VLTLLINAPTTGPIVRKLGLTRVPRVEMKALANIKAQVRRKAILEFKSLRVLFEWDQHEESKLWKQWVVGKMTPLGGGHHGSHSQDTAHDTASNAPLAEPTSVHAKAQPGGALADKSGGEGEGGVKSPSAARPAEASNSLADDASLSGIMMDMARTEAETTETKKGATMSRLKIAGSKVRHIAARACTAAMMRTTAMMRLLL
tara:strand:+ start:1176 stop:1784 length:609 start_codon:yes stop_codon:yes gene_type:complete